MSIAKPLISVVMSTCSRAFCVEEAVNSVLSQTFTDFEFLIADDNSNDNTFEILQNYQRKDKRIKLFKNYFNRGCTFNYRAMQDSAEAEYIAHIDDDDIWTSDKLEKQLRFMENSPDTALSGAFIETFGINARPSWVFYTDNLKLSFMMNFYNPLCHSSIIYRKSFMQKHGINYRVTCRCAQDYDFYKQIILSGGKIANIPEILVKYRMHPNRLTDIKETQKLQIYHAENVKKELLYDFLTFNEAGEIKKLAAGFPFNNYDTSGVLKAIDYAGKKYAMKHSIKTDFLEDIKLDIQNGLFKF